MRLIQAILWRTICVALLVVGIGAFYGGLGEYHETLVEILSESALLRWSVGGGLIVVGLIGLIPWPKRSRDRRRIAFKGAHGNVTIQLDSVEQTLNRATRKITEAKRINARITPSDNARNVHIHADITLRKPANASAREVEARVSQFIVEQTKRILGEETAVTADLNIVDIIIEDTDRPSSEESAGVPLPADDAAPDNAEDSSGRALEDLESEEEELLAERPLPGVALPETDEGEQEQEDEYDDEEPHAEEDEEDEEDEENKDKGSLW